MKKIKYQIANCVNFSFLIFATAFVMTICTVSQSKATQLSQYELKIWNDPTFQKQFAESYKAETEIEPRVTTDEREKMQEILTMISKDQMDKAASLLEKNRDENANALYDFMLANIYFQQEKLEQAAEIYQVAVDKFPKFRRAWRNLALIYVRKNEFRKALPALTRVIELGGSDSITFGLLGFSYSSVENFISAESAFRMAVLLDPVTLDWKMGLARCMFKQENFSQAASLCASLIEEKPENADLWLLQANAYIGLNKPFKAVGNYELVDRLGKSTVESLNMLGDIYINKELYGLAVNSYIRAIEKDSGVNPERAIRAAKVLSVRGAIKETQFLIEKIESLKGDQLHVTFQKELLKIRARLAVAEGSGDAEASILEDIVELDPLDAEALILLGQYYRRSGDDERAIFYYERAASIEKYEADAKVRHAQLLVSNGKYNDALPLLRRAQQLKPRDDVQKYLDQVEHVAKSR